MQTFLVIMVGGLAGLVLMALPVFGRHAHHPGVGHVGVHTGHLPTTPVHGAAHSGTHTGSVRSSGGLLRLTQPRVIFSFAALFGAIGYGACMMGTSPGLGAILAIVPAALLERLVVNRVWNMLMGFQGRPASPMTDLTFESATALTNFHNGKGIVQVIRDGRAVQLTAHLSPDQIALPVNVGDTLRIEEVDATHERVQVTLRLEN